jgi:hypothetical protein
LFLRAAHRHSAVPGGQNAFSSCAFQCILPTRHSWMRMCGPKKQRWRSAVKMMNTDEWHHDLYQLSQVLPSDGEIQSVICVSGQYCEDEIHFCTDYNPCKVDAECMDLGNDYKWVSSLTSDTRF